MTGTTSDPFAEAQTRLIGWIKDPPINSDAYGRVVEPSTVHRAIRYLGRLRETEPPDGWKLMSLSADVYGSIDVDMGKKSYRFTHGGGPIVRRK